MSRDRRSIPIRAASLTRVRRQHCMLGDVDLLAVDEARFQRFGQTRRRRKTPDQLLTRLRALICARLITQNGGENVSITTCQGRTLVNAVQNCGAVRDLGAVGAPSPGRCQGELGVKWQWIPWQTALRANSSTKQVARAPAVRPVNIGFSNELGKSQIVWGFTRSGFSSWGRGQGRFWPEKREKNRDLWCGVVDCNQRSAADFFGRWVAMARSCFGARRRLPKTQAERPLEEVNAVQTHPNGHPQWPLGG